MGDNQTRFVGTILLAVCYSDHNSTRITLCYIVNASFLLFFLASWSYRLLTEWVKYFHGIHDYRLWVRFLTLQQSVSCMAQRVGENFAIHYLCGCPLGEILPPTGHKMCCITICYSLPVWMPVRFSKCGEILPPTGYKTHHVLSC